MKAILFALLSCAVVITSQAQITSPFDTDADGWTFLNSATSVPVTHHAVNGNPGGYISVTYASNTNFATQSWIAPTKFRGNHLVRSLGMNLSFDLQQSLAGTHSNVNGDVRIESASLALVYSLPTKPATAPAWSSYTLKLDETQGWRINATNGTVATRDQIKATLRNITSIEIRGTYITNASYISGIDNVVLEQRTLPTAPSVTSFTPTSGQVGTTLTITGNNFDATAANNAVYFGLVRGTITSASATQINVTVPVGASHDKITVINKVTGLSQNSHLPFNPTFEGGGRIIPASFAPRVDLLFSFSQKGFSMVDIDGDGWIDLAGASNSVDAIEIYRNRGLGGEITTASFDAILSINLPGSNTNGTGLMFADLDGDGLKDMISSSGTSGFSAAFITFRNISTPGNIAFEAPEIWSASSDETPIAHIADLDGDGRPELMSGEGSIGTTTGTYFWADQNISTPGDIEFGPAIGFFNGTVINGFSAVTTGDLDGDGKLELIVTHGQGQSFTILRNISTPGAPAFENTFTISTGIRSLTPADVNMDGKIDLVWKAGLAGDIYIRLNTNSGGALSLSDFATEVILTGDVAGYGGISIADINGDGKPDIVATDNTDAGVYENVYSGGAFDASAFVRAYQYAGGTANTYPTGPRAADLNGDNKPDLIFATTNTTLGRISIFENRNIHAPVISLNTVSPLAGPIGSTVTITGSNFSTIPSENRVWFGGVEAIVLSATATEITVEVPAGAGYERVSVVRNKLTSYYHLPFNVTFSPGVTFDGTSFLPPVTLQLTGADYDVEVADLNNDGKPDIVAESDISFFNGLAYRNVHTSGVITSASFILDDTTSTSAQDLKLMDVDADGKLDILSSAGIYKNSSTTTEINFDAVAGLNNVRFGSWADFNTDGMIDVVSVTNGSGNVSVYENRYRGSGAFLTGTFSTFSAAFTLAKPAINGVAIAADFDNDGLVDLAANNSATDNISIWRNTNPDAYRITASQFTLVGHIAAGDNPGRLYSGDLDLDGKIDLMLYHGAGTNTTLISVFHNQSTTGNIIFNKVDFTIPAAATVAHIRDLDGDGKAEIIVTSESTDQFFILKNTSTPGTINASSFAAPFATAVNNPRGLTTGDLNADGKPEIIITSAPNSLLIFENMIPSFSITFTTQPTASTVCNGATTSFITAASGTTNITYQWQFSTTLAGTYTDINNGGGYTNANTASLSVNTTGNFGAGFYRCRISGDLAAPVFSDAVELTINVIPAAPTVTNGARCGAGSVTLAASGGVDGQYRWYTTATGGIAIAGEVNSNYVTPSLTTTTPYFVSINNGACESNRIPVDAIINVSPPKPIITASITPATGIVTVCDAGPLVLSAPTGFASYAWSSGETTDQINVTLAGSYTVIVTNASGCASESSDPITVITDTTPPSPTAIGTTSCSSGAFTLTASGGTNGQFRWYSSSTGGISIPGEVNSTYTTPIINTTTTYYVSINNGLCESNRIPVDAIINVSPPKPIITASITPATGIVTVCDAAPLVLSAPTGFASYAWSSGETTDQINITLTGSYTVIVTNASGCASESSEPITVITDTTPTSPTVTAASSCGSGSVTLVASGGTNGNYRWYDVATGGTALPGEVNDSFATPALSASATYFVSITNANCESNRVAVTATVNVVPAKPVVTTSLSAIGNAITFCSTSTLTLTAPAGFTNYLWSEGSTSQNITVTNSGAYSVIVSDVSTCPSPASDAIIVTVVPAPCNNSAPVINNTTLITTIGNTVSIDLSTLISDADNNLVLSSLIIVQQPTSGVQASLNGTILQINYAGNSFTGIDVITIRVCDVFGECTTQQLQINVIGEIEIFNAVSHNNDGKNDFFKIQNIDLLEPENTVTIYNRWGSKVFETENYSEINAFRGLSNNGNELPSGTYFYKILLKSTGKTETGYLVLKK